MNSHHFEQKERGKPNFGGEERDDFATGLFGQLCQTKHDCVKTKHQPGTQVRVVGVDPLVPRPGTGVSLLPRNNWLNASLNKTGFC